MISLNLWIVLAGMLYLIIMLIVACFAVKKFIEIARINEDRYGG